MSLYLLGRQVGWRLRQTVLNRISGRSSHIAKLRSDFDAGGCLSHLMPSRIG